MHEYVLEKMAAALAQEREREAARAARRRVGRLGRRQAQRDARRQRPTAVPAGAAAE
jgi:hypothetical protein